MPRTRLTLMAVIEEGSTTAKVDVAVSQWNRSQLIKNARPCSIDYAVKEINPEESVIPWAISTLRGVSDVVVANLIHRMGEGEVVLMHDVDQQLLF